MAAAKKDAVQRRLVRQANRMQVLIDLAKATSDSLQDLVAAESSLYSDPGKDYLRAEGLADNALGTADRLVGSGAEQTLGAPSTGPAHDPLSRRTVTRSTVLGILGQQCRPLAVRSPAFRRSHSTAYDNRPAASPSEARLAVCRRMSTPCLLRRVARGRWSATSHDCAVRVLMDRDAAGERA